MVSEKTLVLCSFFPGCSRAFTAPARVGSCQLVQCSLAFTLYSAAILLPLPQSFYLLVWRFVFWFRVLGNIYTNFSAQCGPDLGSSYA